MPLVNRAVSFKALLWLPFIVFFQGCASQGGQYNRVDSHPVGPDEYEDYQAFQEQLVLLPYSTQQLILSESRLLAPRQQATAGEASKTRSPGDYRARLGYVLQHTQQPALLPDSQFQSLKMVVNGDREDTRTLYRKMFVGYLSSPEFNCRQPLFFAYFANRYSLPAKRHTELKNACSAIVPFSLITYFGEEQVIWLDTRRVRDIHLLFAGKNNKIASRFGHVAIRLVVCPEVTSSDEECAANLYEHIVLGFQAHVDDLSISTLKGLTGKYKAFLFASQFIDVYQNYAITEFRTMHSLPLIINEVDRPRIVRSLSEIHWQYTGDYKFITNNCATLLQDALHVIWPQYAQRKNPAKVFLRPDSFFGAIQNPNLSLYEKLSPLATAEQAGYYFSSTREFYLQALQYMNESMDSHQYLDLTSYLLTEPLLRRAAREDDPDLMKALSNNNKLKEAHLMLEEYAVLTSERQLRIESALYMEEQNFAERQDEVTADMSPHEHEVFKTCILDPHLQRRAPKQSSDGIPRHSSNAGAQDLQAYCYDSGNRQLLADLLSNIKGARSAQWKRMKEVSRYWSDSIENVKLLKGI